ncbi:uncharacterized protein LOC113231114 [Hyposmocoma kahamanoa]|uniref:uncharacterized protein LOC113231114 n=1 Tax=Hyposmocoma kahamanoa TaxID=1477025 RepID=UPI000E6D86EC|nr:uncharacterized protein LOC113231114 [Hyposmocoma kahamanoa]
MSIYVWKVGEIALARLSRKVYAKVRVVKNEDGVFHDEKVLGISCKEDGSIKVTKQLCYHVEISRTGQNLWLPYTSLYLAERSRPFYGKDKVLNSKPVPKTNSMPRKRKVKEDHILPMEVKLTKHNDPDLNTTFDIRHMPMKLSKYENAFKEFVRRGKETLFDHFYNVLEENMNVNLDILDYLKNVNASTEDKFETVIKNIVTEKEIENYLHQCWRYNFVNWQSGAMENKEGCDHSKSNSPEKTIITLHTSWCLVCGQKDKLRECVNCPSSFHLACRKEWLVTIIHRKNPPQKVAKPTTIVQKILSSTRTICSVKKDREPTDLCPSCMWGPRVGYDDVVWHRLRGCPWWPARVLTPGAAPSCLLARTHSPTHWPLRYYGTLNYSWGESERMSLFLPAHASQASLAALEARDPMLRQALLDACDDYISVYLT